MYRTRLSRASLAALAIAALASGSTLVASDTAQAGRIDPGFSRGPPRIDPGFGRGPAQIDPGFTKSSGLHYIAKRERDSGLHSHCRWIDGPVNVGAPQPKHPGQHGNKVKVCY